MSQPILIKVYGSFWPADEQLCKQIGELSASALPEAPDIVLEGNLLKISFEGIYFPIDEVLEALKKEVSGQGKIDVLDIEDWQMSRHLIQAGHIGMSKMPLNNVLDFSGH